jgi:Tol biopolymer transport system component
MVGTRIVHYEVREKLGAGGMGEVWRATDSKLGRDVALKVLPGPLASDVERMARFRREAQVLASLNHPNIGAIYGIESAGDVHCLVLELVRGETLAARMERGAVPLDEALPIARQIADAMEAAHDQGVLHRDLKPGNVMITPDNTVKVLDFGLAKAFEGDAGTDSRSISPTVTARNTLAGVILGTPAYMSPEQAKGKPVDRRADIWAFGVVLYEMLRGQRAFTGETASEVMAAVMMREIEWDRLPNDLPAPLLRLLRRCLEKDPRRRLRDIGEARLVIEDYLANPAAAEAAAATTAPPAPARRASRLPLAAAAALVVIAALVAWSPWRAPAPPPPVMEFDVELSPEPLFSGYGSAAVLSRQGDRIAFVPDGEDRLMYVRDLSDPTPREIAGTDLAYHQFFSPNGDWIAFFTRTELKKVSIRGGAPLILAPVALNRGGTWTDDGAIVYAPNPNSPLMSIPESGGEARAITQLDSTTGEISHRWPRAIPGRSAVLFTVFGSAPGFEKGRLEVLDLKSGKRKVLHHGGTDPRYVPTGHILYLYEQTLFALPFDVGRMEVTGNPVPLVEQLRASAAEGAAQYDVSMNGTMIGMFGEAASASLSELVRIPLAGGAEQVMVEPAVISGPAVSPDGRRVAYTLGAASDTDVWVLDAVRGTRTRLTFNEGRADWRPAWSPDGKSIAYSSASAKGGSLTRLCVKSADGSGEERSLSSKLNMQVPEQWTPDGGTILFSQNVAGNWGLWKTSALAETEHELVVDTPMLEFAPRLSSDGRWLAYQSGESGRPEVYVRPFPGPGGKWQISSQGGTEPRWSRRGMELFYRSGDSLYSVSVVAGKSSIEAARPRSRIRIPAGPGSVQGSYDLTPDGAAVVAARQIQRDRDVAPLRRVRVTLNWFERLRELKPVASK